MEGWTEQEFLAGAVPEFGRIFNYSLRI